MSQRRLFWPGLLVGGALGVGLGLLLAPESGSALRRRLRGWAGDVDQGVEDFLARTSQSANELLTDTAQGLRGWAKGFQRRVLVPPASWLIRLTAEESLALDPNGTFPEKVRSD